MNDLLTKSDIMRMKGWSYEFLTNLIKIAHIPHIPGVKTVWYTLEDVEAGFQRIKQGGSWESTESKGRRTGNMTSRYRGKGIGAARRQLKEAKLNQSSPNAEARPY